MFLKDDMVRQPIAPSRQAACRQIATADADADADASDALKSEERILSAPQRMYTQTMALPNRLFEKPGRIKSALFSRESRPLFKHED